MHRQTAATLPTAAPDPSPTAAEDFQLLGWRGSLERLPRLLLTLCEGAEPACQADSPLSPGSRGRSPIEVEFGVLGRDGARMAVRQRGRAMHSSCCWLVDCVCLPTEQQELAAFV